MECTEQEQASPPTLHERWCPSAFCQEGAVLLGIVGADGRIGYITPQMTISQQFVDEAQKGRKPTKRFRFAQPCLESRCTEWKRNRCNVIDRALAETTPPLPGTEHHGMPSCSIRPTCRWFAQRGASACAVCPLVITDMWPDEA